MAQGYIGVFDQAKKVKKLYVGVNGQAKAAKKAYIGDANGKAKLWYSASPITTFSYTLKNDNPAVEGTDYVYNSNENEWSVIFKSSGTLEILSINTPIDIFLLGGGSNGAAGSGKVEGNNQYWYGGKGGNGGTRKTVSNISLKEQSSYIITVGGVGAHSSAFGHSSNEVEYDQAIGGAQCGKGDDGGYAFKDSTFDGIKYGAAGGGGGYIQWLNQIYGSSTGAGAGGADGGGAGGGGHGDYDWDKTGTSATQYGGGGGGGNGGASSASSGKQGLVIIRSHKI